MSAKMIFLHIPKTAGTSLRRMLATQYERDDIHPVPCGKDMRNKGYPTSTRIYDHVLTLNDVQGRRLVMGHYRFPQVAPLLSEFRIVTFFRHPVEQFLSYYRFMQQTVEYPHHDLVKNMTLDQFIENATTLKFWTNTHTRYLTGNIGTPITTANIATAKTVLDSFDIIGAVEHFTKSLNRLEQRFGYQFKELLHTNITKTDAHYPASVRNRIAELQAADMELYGTLTDRFRQYGTG